jgi:hypothetical protein
MRLSDADVAAAAAIVGEAATLRAAIRLLRARFPHVPASVVDAFDLRDEQAAHTVGRRALFLACTDGHCWSVTCDAGAASAFVLTESA